MLSTWLRPMSGISPDTRRRCPPNLPAWRWFSAVASALYSSPSVKRSSTIPTSLRVATSASSSVGTRALRARSRRRDRAGSTRNPCAPRDAYRREHDRDRSEVEEEPRSVPRRGEDHQLTARGGMLSTFRLSKDSRVERRRASRRYGSAAGCSDARLKKRQTKLNRSNRSSPLHRRALSCPARRAPAATPAPRPPPSPRRLPSRRRR